MSFLKNLQDRIPIGGGRISILAVVFICFLILAHLLFVRSSILPQYQTSKDLAAQLDKSEQELLTAQRAGQEEPERLKEQVSTAQAQLEEAAAKFMDESQAAKVLNRLYQYAGESAVEITDLQTRVGPESEGKEIYDARTFRLEVQGAFSRLTNFVSRIQEAVASSMVITGVNIAAGDGRHVLTMEVTLYTSPYISGADGGVPTPTPDPAQLEAALATAWSSADWETSIGLINQLLVLNPYDSELAEKLYVAYVNRGQQFLAEGNDGGAVTQFNAALEIKPDGAEALAGLAQAVATPVPTLTFEEQLVQSLDGPWIQENWDEVIDIIGQILEINPGNQEILDKLYAAHVNHGYQFAIRGELEQAKQAFTRALEINPEGQEAIAGLRALAEGNLPATPVPTSAYVTYVVQHGDTLYSISRRYNTTVQAIMSANGLTSTDIRVGQQLRVPTQ